MRGFTLAAALVAALTMAGAAHATAVLWVGPTDGTLTDWEVGNNWDDGGGAATSLETFGNDAGWEQRQARIEDPGDPAAEWIPNPNWIPDPEVVIPAGANVVVQMIDVGNFHFASRGRGNPADPDADPPVLQSINYVPPATNGDKGSLRIEGGGQLEVRSGPGGDVDGNWTQMELDDLTITGAGSAYRQTRVTDGAGVPANGGNMNLGSWRADGANQAISLNVLNGAEMSVDGSLVFGAQGDNEIGLSVQAEISSGASMDLFNGANDPPLFPDNDDSACNPPGGAAGQPCQSSLMFVYGYDDAGATWKGEDYKLNFTGHGGSITVDHSGIMLLEHTGFEDGAGDILYVNQLDGPGTGVRKESYQDLYAGITHDNPQNPGTPLATKQILTANGSNALPFGDNFAVVGTPGADGYKVTMIREAGLDGTNPGDITGDGLVNAADAGAMFAGWTFGVVIPGTTIAVGDIADNPVGGGTQPFDDSVDAIDYGQLISAGIWTGDPGPVTEGTASAVYDIFTGEIIVSADGVNNWYITSATDGLTGAPPVFPNDDNGLRSDSDNLIGETSLGILPGFDNHNLGAVAQLGLLEGDLTIWSNAGVGTPLLQGIVERVPEPASVALIALGLCGVLASRRRLVA